MSEAEAQRVAKEYVLKHRKSLRANRKEIKCAVERIARVLVDLKPAQRKVKVGA